MGCRRALGWLAAERAIPHEDLRLKSLLPSSDRAGVSHAFDYSQFLLDERHVSPYTQGMNAPVLRLDTPQRKAKILIEGTHCQRLCSSQDLYCTEVMASLCCACAGTECRLDGLQRLASRPLI